MKTIVGFHAHVYFDPETQATATELRKEVGGQFAVQLGRVHSKPIGPHSKGMFQIAFAPTLFSSLVPWLMLHRNGLDVLIHPETGDELADHSTYAAWLGARLPLDLGVLAN